MKTTKTSAMNQVMSENIRRDSHARNVCSETINQKQTADLLKQYFPVTKLSWIIQPPDQKAKS
jgi:hypothetical protein